MSSRRPWKLSVHVKAKTKSLDLKFKAKAKNLPASTSTSNSKLFPFRFSIILKLCPFHIKLKSKPHSSVPTWKSNFRRVLHSLHVPGSANNIAPTPASASDPTLIKCCTYRCRRQGCTGSVLVENVALLCGSMSKKDMKGILLHSCVLLSCLSSKFKDSIKRSNVLLLMLAALVACSFVLLHFKNHIPITPKLFQFFR